MGDREDRDARLARRSPEQLLTSSGSPSAQAAKPGRGEHVVERDREPGPVLRRVERLEVEDPTFVERGRLDPLDERRRGRGRARRSKRAGPDVERRMCSRLCIGSGSIPASARSPDTAADPRSGSASSSSSTACGGAAKDRSSERASRLAGRRVDGDLASLAKARDAGAVLVPVLEPFFQVAAVFAASSRGRGPVAWLRRG